MTLHVDAPAGSTITFPEKVEKIGEFDVIAVDQWNAIPVDTEADRRRWTQSMRIETLKTGDQRIPELTIRYQLPNSDTKGTVVIEPIEIIVDSVLRETESTDITRFREIKGTVESDSEATTRSRVLPLLLALLTILAVSTAFWLWHRRQAKVPIDVWAKSEISSIRRRGDRSTDQSVQLHSELMTVFRQYVSERLGIDARSMSTSEIVRAIEASEQIPSRSIASIKPMLAAADRARFAAVGSSTDLDTSCDVLRDFVTQTRPQPESRRRGTA